MTGNGKTYNLTGLLITIAFHLLVLVVFLSIKLGEAKLKNTELLAIELAPEEIKTLEKIVSHSQLPINANFQVLSQEALSNIASNTAQKLNENISTDKYVNELMNELGIKDLNPQHSNALPNEEAISEDNSTLKSEQQKKKEDKENSFYFGASRVEYNLADGRKARYVDRPIYRCQGGGTVVVKIAIDQAGQIIESKIESTTSSEECIIEAAINSANRFLFKSDYNAPKRVEGRISYIFVPQ